MSKIINKNQLDLLIESTIKEYDEALGKYINLARKMSPSEGKLPKILSIIHDLVNLDFKAAKHSITNKKGFSKISYLFRELNLIGLILDRINNNACKGGSCLRGLDITDLKKPAFNELVEYGFDVDQIIKYLKDPDVLEYLQNDVKLRFRMGELDSIIMFLEELKDQYDSIVRNESRSIKKGFKTTIKESGMKMEADTCNECGAMMYEGLCEAGCGSNYMEEGSYMKEDELEEGDAFGKAVSDAKKAGKTEFEFQGKTYPVKESDSVEESVKDLAESVTKTFNPSFLTEEMDNFKKLINYRNK